MGLSAEYFAEDGVCQVVAGPIEVFGSEPEESDMYNIKHTALVLFAAVGALASVTTGASAKAVAPAQACSGNCTSSIVSAWTAGAMPRDDFFESDTDSANANNPALPPYARGRGQEAGGPARELIPN
nr:hypothetical protein [Methylorubrum extorquens]